MDRIEAKDFVDLYFLIEKEEISVTQLLSGVKKKFGLAIDALTIGSEFAKVNKITQLPRMLLPLTLAELKTFFETQARLLQSEIVEE